VGKAADMTVLSQDIMTVDESVLLDTEVTMTVIGGEVLYQGNAAMVNGI
jgi:predicted amidohydrolase YtcJ